MSFRTTFKQWKTVYVLHVGESDDCAHERRPERLAGVVEGELMADFAYCRRWRVSADDRLKCSSVLPRC